MQHSVEDRAFGPDVDEGCGGPPGTWTDRVTAYMLPFVLTLLMMCVVVYSLGKGIEYQDLFQNRRCRMYLFASNAVVIVGTTLLISYSVHNEAIKRTSPGI